jgi:drug/metabolite transporter (DMT)-like permease
MLSIILLQALYGTSIPISKFLLSMCSPFFLTGIRMVSSGVLLLGYNWWMRKTKFIFNKKHIWLYAQIIVFGIYFKYLLRYWALSHLPAVKFSFMLNATPFLAALFSFIWFGTKLTKKQWAGLLLGFFGLVPIVVLRTQQELLTTQLFFISWPEIALFLAIVCHVYTMFIMQILIREHKSSVSGINGVCMFFGGILALTTILFGHGSFVVTDVATFSLGLITLILISNIICQNWYIHLLKKYSVTFISLTDFINQLATIFYSWLFLKEVITWHYGICAIIVFIGLYLFYQDELQLNILELQKP